MIVCTYEDREDALVGVKILVLSLARHCPDVDVHAFAPACGNAFRQWAGRQPRLRLHTSRPDGPPGWNVKPAVLLDRLAAGHDEVVWLDSDIVLAGDFRPACRGLAPDVCVVAEELPWPSGGDGSAPRTRAFGFDVGRAFPRAINSGVVRVTPAHRALLDAWRELLARSDYLDAQRLKAGERPLHHVGDQDGLAALLGSTGFAAVPVRLLRSPRDILYAGWGPYDGYPLSARLRHLATGLPPLVHAFGAQKPWSAAIARRRSAGLSPYLRRGRAVRRGPR